MHEQWVYIVCRSQRGELYVSVETYRNIHVAVYMCKTFVLNEINNNILCVWWFLLSWWNKQPRIYTETFSVLFVFFFYFFLYWFLRYKFALVFRNFFEINVRPFSASSFGLKLRIENSIIVLIFPMFPISYRYRWCSEKMQIFWLSVCKAYY